MTSSSIGRPGCHRRYPPARGSAPLSFMGRDNGPLASSQPRLFDCCPTGDAAVSRGRELKRACRLLLVAFAINLLVGPQIAQSQPASRAPRVGVALQGAPPDPLFEAFRQGLRELGYTEGRTIEIEYRSARGNPERLPDLIAELVRLRVDVIVTSGDPGTPAAKRATSTIPIVFAVHADPVGAGLVASLARPGGNVTGLSSMTGDLVMKRLELLKEAVPKLSSVVVLRDPRHPISDLRLAEAASRVLGLRLRVLQIEDIGDLEKALAGANQPRADALVNLQSSFLYAHRERIVKAVAAARLPAIYHHLEFVEAGGLMAYGPDFRDLFRRAATYVDKILHGTKPADIPVEQPTTLKLVINLNAAKAVDVVLPQSLLLRADRVIGQ